MTERIPEAELRVVEALEDGNRSALLFALRLVAEVRRLRGLIVGAFPNDHVQTHWMSPSFGTEWVPGMATRALLAEARAIREEQTVGFAIPVILGSPEVAEPRVQWAGIPRNAEGVKRIYINGKPFVPET